MTIPPVVATAESSHEGDLSFSSIAVLNVMSQSICELLDCFNGNIAAAQRNQGLAVLWDDVQIVVAQLRFSHEGPKRAQLACLCRGSAAFDACAIGRIGRCSQFRLERGSTTWSPFFRSPHIYRGTHFTKLRSLATWHDQPLNISSHGPATPNSKWRCRCVLETTVCKYACMHAWTHVCHSMQCLSACLAGWLSSRYVGT